MQINIEQLAEKFSNTSKILSVSEFGSGNVNDTYLVHTESSKFILQRINKKVFLNPNLVMKNISLISEHINNKLKNNVYTNKRKWVFLEIIPLRTGEEYLIDQNENFWRAYSYLDNSCSYEIIKDKKHAFECGWVIGNFHDLIHDINIKNLHDTLPGFHITPKYIMDYEKTVANLKHERSSPEKRYLKEIVAKKKDYAYSLERAKESADLSIRAIHGDPKVSNILIDIETNLGLSIIDLDTTKSGLIQYDIGDLLRSSCNPLGEETLNFENITFETDIMRAILDGYFEEKLSFISLKDIEYILPSVKTITFELGLRFYLDYLNGNKYFKVKNKDHNLKRAIVQFKLLESIETKEKEIEKMIKDYI